MLSGSWKLVHEKAVTYAFLSYNPWPARIFRHKNINKNIDIEIRVRKLQPNVITCMAANEDKKSLHCSSKNLSFEVTFTISATKQLVSSTCYKLMLLDILLEVQIYSHLSPNSHCFTIYEPCQELPSMKTKWGNKKLASSKVVLNTFRIFHLAPSQRKYREPKVNMVEIDAYKGQNTGKKKATHQILKYKDKNSIGR